MHANTCFLRRHDKCQDEHPDEEYPKDPQSSQTQPLQQEMISNGHHPKLMAAMEAERRKCTIRTKDHLLNKTEAEKCMELSNREYHNTHQLSLLKSNAVIY